MYSKGVPCPSKGPMKIGLLAGGPRVLKKSPAVGEPTGPCFNSGMMFKHVMFFFVNISHRTARVVKLLLFSI